jgi:putative heme-binding domain-containing protein
MPRGERSRVGPNLSGVNNRNKETLLSHILEPSAAIESRYTNYILVTKDAYVHDGLLAGETPGTVTLRGEREDITVLRQNIKELRAPASHARWPGRDDDAKTGRRHRHLRAGL